MEMEAFEKTATGVGGFEKTKETIILKCMRLMFVMISMICAFCSIVILDMVNTFLKIITILKQR